MAFRLRAGEPVARAIRRMARAELRTATAAAVDAARPLPERVHEVRTSLKKARALARLARPTVGRRARRAERRLAAVGASLGELRDGDVLLATLDGLLRPEAEREAGSSGSSSPRGGEGEAPAAAPTPPGVARDFLAAEVVTPVPAGRAEARLAKAAARLDRERRRLDRWGLPRRRDGRALRRGLVDGYRCARRAMERAFQADSGAAFHRWRKAVKAHRYQMQLLADVWPQAAPAAAAELERLGELLGAEHDLTLLGERLAASRNAATIAVPLASSVAVGGDRPSLSAQVERRRRALRAEARLLGRRLFAERPSELRERLRRELRPALREAAAAAAVPSGEAAERPRRRPASAPASASASTSASGRTGGSGAPARGAGTGTGIGTKAKGRFAGAAPAAAPASPRSGRPPLRAV